MCSSVGVGVGVGENDKQSSCGVEGKGVVTKDGNIDSIDVCVRVTTRPTVNDFKHAVCMHLCRS